MRRAAGSPAEVARKLVRLARGMGRLAHPTALDARLARLVALGYLDRTPTRLQLVVGSIDMLRFWISPAANEYYASQGIDFSFHQVLRVLEEPASMIDPTGLLTSRDVIIDHLLQVVHANPAYDLTLLETHERGLEELEAQTIAAIERRHPKSACLAATIEDPTYWERLLGYTRAYLRDRSVPPPLRANIEGSARWAPIERTFGTLPAALRYFAKMPRTPGAAARHLATVRSFPVALAEPIRG
jgi:hypothetical protein